MKRNTKDSVAKMTSFLEKGAKIGFIEVTRQHRQQRINDFIERTWPKEGKARLPRLILFETGIREFMDNLNQDHINFSNKYLDMLDWFTCFMDSLPDTDDIEEVANQARKFHEEQAIAGRTISFTEAVAHVTGHSNQQTMERTLMAS